MAWAQLLCEAAPPAAARCNDNCGASNGAAAPAGPVAHDYCTQVGHAAGEGVACRWYGIPYCDPFSHRDVWLGAGGRVGFGGDDTTYDTIRKIAHVYLDDGRARRAATHGPCHRVVQGLGQPARLRRWHFSTGRARGSEPGGYSLGPCQTRAGQCQCTIGMGKLCVHTYSLKQNFSKNEPLNVDSRHIKNTCAPSPPLKTGFKSNSQTDENCTPTILFSCCKQKLFYRHTQKTWLSLSLGQ